MRKNHAKRGRIVLGAIAIVALLGGSAFTATNTVPTSVAGYGEATVSGATVSDIAYNTLTTDSSKLASVVFTSTTNVTGHTATLTLKGAGVLVGSSPYACTLGTWDTLLLKMTITCATSDNPAISAFDTTGLTVVQ